MADMNYALGQFIDEAIQLELNAAEIYAIFSESIPADADFWAGMSWEERNHAALLKTGKDILMPREKFPGEILPDFIQSLIDTNRCLGSLREKYSQTPPDRSTAFAVALKIENSAGEMHFQKVMESRAASRIVQILQELCEDDINHYARIKRYMNEVGESGKSSQDEVKKILIVIDDASVAKLLQTILATEGEIDVAANGNEGLQRIRKNDYDLIVSTVEMPMLDGLRFYTHAKAYVPDLHKKFLFFTGAPTADRISFFEAEKLRYLIKPSTINEIRGTALSILA